MLKINRHMRFMLDKLGVAVIVLFCLCLFTAVTVSARETPAPVIDATGQRTSKSTTALEERVDMLERKLNSQTLVEILTRLDSLQQELQKLVGQSENLNHEIEGIKKRQRDLYLDVDRRISKVEKMASDQPAGVSQIPPDLSALQQDSSLPNASTIAPLPLPGADSNTARQAYEKAFNLLKDRRYPDAVTEFQIFLKTYPNTSYADKAQYWLGEANYVQQQYVTALTEFTKVIARYPNSPKRPDAMLKIGYTYDALGKEDKSQKFFEDVVAQFPDTTAARLASKRLKNQKRQ